MSEHDRLQKKIRAIIKFFGADFFKGLKILDVGSGDGTIARAFHDLGAHVTCVDARKNLLDSIRANNPKINCVKVDLDQDWPFNGEFFDLILHLGTLNHLMYIEKHLNFVCQSSNYLVLETQVCDSFKPNKYVLVKENKHDQNNSFNGVGCKPSPAFIERIMSAADLDFQAIADESLNHNKFCYDWVGKDSNSIQFGLSRIWFAKRKEFKNLSTTKNNNINNSRWRPGPATLPQRNSTPVYNTASKIFRESEISTNESVRRISKEFSIIHSENFSIDNYLVNAVICPVSFSARNWYKKISPIFPNLRLHQSCHSMEGFAKSANEIDLVMTSIDKLTVSNNIWIDEWDNKEISPEQINTLSKCKHILTSSLINETQLRIALPYAKITRCTKSWPVIKGDFTKINDFIYFEKSSSFTKALVDLWDDSWGKLTIVGSTVKLPAKISYLSDIDSYEDVFTKVAQSKYLIDLSLNRHYNSGIVELAQKLNLQVISNNTSAVSNLNYFIDSNSKTPTLEELSKPINYMLSSKFDEIKQDLSNKHIKNNLEKMLGKNA